MMNVSSLPSSMIVETPQSSIHYKMNGDCSQLVKTHYSLISYYNEFISLRELLYPIMINNYYKKIGEMSESVKVNSATTTKFANERFSIYSINKIFPKKIFRVVKLINKNEVVLK